MAKCLCSRDAGWGRNRCNNCYAKDDYYGSIGKESFIFGKKVKFTRGFCNGRIGILINHDGESFKWGAGGTSKKYKIELEDGLRQYKQSLNFRYQNLLLPQKMFF